jgi:aspartate kinase
MKTSKFGGSSMSYAGTIQRVIEIIKSDPDRKCIVVSAPGKRSIEDDKITNLLYAWAESKNENAANILQIIKERFLDIAEYFKIKIDLDYEFQIMTGTKKNNPDNFKDYAASRGEYLCAKIMAKILGFTFVDAISFIRFDEAGRLDLDETKKMTGQINLIVKAESKGIVVPGFYGLTPSGKVKTFPRGGSDITGAILAYCTLSDIYENWTDVPGIMTAHPGIVANAKIVSDMSNTELRELAYRGADVLHEDTIFPASIAGIPINVRSTFEPEKTGHLYSAMEDPV